MVGGSAYKTARAGGRHRAWYHQQLTLGQRQLQKAARSLRQQIQQHRAWIQSPQTKVSDWEHRDGRYREGLLKKWQMDIHRQSEQLDIVLGVLQERGYDERDTL
jgi:glutamate synthase domain-containing protein 3